MTTNKLLAAFLVFTTILAAFGGSGLVQNALAQPQNPPTLSSKEEIFSPDPLTETQVYPASDGPANDEYVPENPLPLQTQPSSVPFQNLGVDSDSWIGSIPHGVQSGQIQGGMGIQATVLYDNGPFVTHPGGGFNGYDASALQTALGLTTFGFNTTKATGYRLGEDFTIPPGRSWQIDNISFYAYQTDNYAVPPVSTITALYLQIWDGPPDNPASSIVFGDLVTNRLVDTYWTNIYRVLDTSLTNPQRPIMAAIADINSTLAPGTYWLDWSLAGSLSSGPFTPPITILGQTTTGNALAYDAVLNSWGPADDQISQQGMPFVIEGTISDWLWDQPISAINPSAYIAQEFPDIPAFSSFLSDDFVVPDVWKVDTIFVPGNGWSNFTSLENATALNWKIYVDDGGLPAGDPSGGGALPVWSLTLAPSSPYVTLSVGYGGALSNSYLQLPIPLKLSAGHYWLVFYATLAIDPFGQFGLHPADTKIGEVAKFINPGNGFGYGTEWQDWTAIGVTLHDFAFSIGGSSAYSWKSIDAINSIGRSRPAAAAVNGKIYLFGGETPSGGSGGRADTVEEYDPGTNTWTTQAGLMPIPASNICAAAIGTDIYIPGGYDASFNFFNTLQIYHTTSDTWSTVASDPLPQALSGSGCAALNGKLYVFGGFNLGGYQSAAYVYNPAAAAGSRWSTLPSMAQARAYLGGVAVNGKIYAVGGRELATDFAYVEVYNPSDNAWHTVTSLSKARGGVGVYAVGNTLYACGGGWVSYFDDCEVYETTQGYSGAWTTHPAVLIEGRRTFAYANVGPVLYAIAGYNGTFPTSAERWSFEVYLPITIK